MAKFTIGRDVVTTLGTWANSLRQLSLPENIDGYEWSGTIDAGEEVAITHGLKVIPTRFVVLQARVTNLLITGPTRATTKFFYLKNRGTTTQFTGKVLILP